MRRRRRKYEVKRDGARALRVKALDAKHALMTARLKHTGLRITIGETYGGLAAAPLASEAYTDLDMTDVYRCTVHGLTTRIASAGKGMVTWRFHAET